MENVAPTVNELSFGSLWQNGMHGLHRQIIRKLTKALGSAVEKFGLHAWSLTQDLFDIARPLVQEIRAQR